MATPAGSRSWSSGRWPRRPRGRLRRDRRRAHRGQPALGGQQPDHQRPDALALGHRDLDRRRRRRHQRRGRHPARSPPTTVARRWSALVDASEAAPGRRTGRRRRPAGRAATPHDDDWDGRPGRDRRRGVRASSRRRSARRSRGWAAADRLLYGFAEHTLTSTYLGTSTGLRRRFDQPDGRLELNGKSADLRRSAWVGAAHQRLHRRRRRGADRRPEPAAGLGRAPGSTCRPAATRRCCRRPRWPT